VGVVASVLGAVSGIVGLVYRLGVAAEQMIGNWVRARHFRRAPADAVLAGALVIAGQVEVWLAGADAGLEDGQRVVLAASTAVGAVMLVWRRRWPLAIGLLVPLVEMVVVAAVTDYGTVSTFLASLIALYTAAAWSGSRWWWLVLPLRVVAGVTVGEDAADWAFVGGLAVVSVVAGRVVHNSRRVADELARVNEALRDERETTARLMISEERTAIAREVHDILAHTVSVMVVQAEMAEELFDKDGQRSRSAITSVQSTGREALTELRRILAFLRTSDSIDADIQPQPQLARLPELVESLGEAGLTVSVTVTGEVRRLAPGVDLCAFRVVQEALTNVLRHSGCSTARADLRYHRNAIEVEIVDDGSGRSAPVTLEGAGHGLRGMRERVALYGGEITTGPKAGGGFVVRARLPDAAVLS
jgi:signal transduction histidine kinase